jgi:hypothetical protein
MEAAATEALTLSAAQLPPEIEVRAVSMEVGQAAIRTRIAKKAAALRPEGGAEAWVEAEVDGRGRAGGPGVVVVVGAAEVVAERRKRISTSIWTRKTKKV